ncbi:MAG: glycosyltransferase family 2 protein [Lachnospiraceae bacterium]
MNPTVSIIVPVYNAESTISRCIDSILTQEYTDFELILVDDGSQDSSGAICDQYASYDSRVRVIHKANSGVSDSRNMALDQARGIYIQFLDSDDWITPNATQLFVDTATHFHCDLVISDFYRVVGERVSVKGDIEDDCIMTQEEFASHMVENPADFYYGVLWNKLYRRDIIKNHQLRMDTSISWCEDFMFNLEYLRYAETIYALQVPIYYYVKTKGSLASQGMNISKTIRMKLMVFEYYNNFYKHVLDETDYEKNRLQIYRFLIDAAGDGTVPPTIFPNSKKLGEERSQISEATLSAEGILMDEYRSRKLLDYYLESVAQKNNLSLEETRLLLCLNQPHQCNSRLELSDFTGLTPRKLSSLLQKLSSKGLVKVNTKRETKSLIITFLPTALPILEELANAQGKYDQARFDGFTEEELIQYSALSEKMKRNMQKIL